MCLGRLLSFSGPSFSQSSGCGPADPSFIIPGSMTRRRRSDWSQRFAVGKNDPCFSHLVLWQHLAVGP